MAIEFDLPDDLMERIAPLVKASGLTVEQWVTEKIMREFKKEIAQDFASGQKTFAQVKEVLSFETDIETYQFLKDHGVSGEVQHYAK